MKLKIKETGEILEDVEETKRWWAITAWGDVYECSQNPLAVIEKQTIGNYFETKEEAEKAVEKLKAWKRLKDKGFRVIDYGDEDIRYEIKDRYDGCLFDLETVLFGGEE